MFKHYFRKIYNLLYKGRCTNTRRKVCDLDWWADSNCRICMHLEPISTECCLYYTAKKRYVVFTQVCDYCGKYQEKTHIC